MSKRRQPQRLPPPIMHGDEAIDSEVVLIEFEGELGLLLWKTVRGVRLWAELPDRERSHAFDESAHARRVARIEAAGAPGEIAPAMVKAAAVLQPRARTATVAKACREIAEWAAADGKLGTAIELMQAAAMVVPGDAEVAHEVGRLARTRTEYARAEMWYRQAVSRARKGQDWYEFSRSYIGLGKIFLLRGSYPQAKRSLVRGLRAAKRFSIRPLAARAYHELMVVAIRSDRLPEASNYATSALKAYGPGDRLLPALAHDYGVYLMKLGHFDAALRTFVACGTEAGPPLDRLARAAVIVRAAGNVGNPEHYRSAWGVAESLLDDPSVQTFKSVALLEMARGAAAIRDLEVAATTGERARQLAEERSEFGIREAANALLESLPGTVRIASRPGDELRSVPENELRPVPESVAGAVEAFEALTAGAEALTAGAQIT